MRSCAALAATLGFAVGARAGPAEVTAVRRSVLGETTRITIEVSGEFSYHLNRLHDPERLYIDFAMARPHLGSQRLYSRQFADKLVTRVRVAVTAPGVTRVVLDLAAPAAFAVSRTSHPGGLSINLTPPGRQPGPSEAPPSAALVTVAEQIAGGAERVPDKRPALELSSASAQRGGAAHVVISLSAKPGDRPAALEWELVYPSVPLGTGDGGVVIGSAAETVGKSLTCAGRAEGAGKYIYHCVLAGGSRAIPDGPVAQVTFQVRASARSGRATLEFLNALGATTEGKKMELATSRAAVTIE